MVRCFGLIAVVLATTPYLPAQDVEKPLPAKYEINLRGKPDAPNLRMMGEGVVWEAAGARVTLPGGKGAQRASGLSPDFRVEGDFDIMVAYEIIQLDQPAKGFGNGPSLYVAIDAKTGDAVSMARRITTSGKNAFVTARTQTAAKKNSGVFTRPADATTGKMRIQRVGKMARFFCAEGDDAEFQFIGESLFAEDPISFIQIGGNPGGGEAALDIRLVEFRIRAERLPGYDAAAPVAAPAPPANGVQQPSANLWLYLAGAVALLFAMLAAVGVLAVLLLRRRSVASDRNVANQKPISFVCTECGKNLKIKPTSAGKKVKCPHCGHATQCMSVV